MMKPELDPAAQSALAEYLARLDAVLPGAWVYLTGSAALGDWLPGHSDLDILVVTGSAPAEADLDALAALHTALPGRPYRDAVYVPRDELGAHRSPGGPGVPHAIDGVFSRSGHQPDPVLWATLDRHALTVRGPAAAGLGAGPDPRWLREWNLDNLTSYWRPRAADGRVCCDLVDAIAADAARY
jgi:Nucleotidyltransferase domain